MSNFPKCHISFRIYDDILDPMEITEMLCIEPEISHKKGDSNTSISKKGKLIKYSPYNSGMWSISSKEAENAIIEEHINNLLELLEPSKDKLAELFNRGYKMDLFCGLFAKGCSQPGLDIDSSTMRRLGELNISIAMCFY